MVAALQCGMESDICLAPFHPEPRPFGWGPARVPTRVWLGFLVPNGVKSSCPDPDAWSASGGWVGMVGEAPFEHHETIDPHTGFRSVELSCITIIPVLL